MCNINNNNNDNSNNDNDNDNKNKNNINNIKIHYCGGTGQFSCCSHIKEGEQDFGIYVNSVVRQFLNVLCTSGMDTGMEVFKKIFINSLP